MSPDCRWARTASPSVSRLGRLSERFLRSRRATLASTLSNTSCRELPSPAAQPMDWLFGPSPTSGATQPSTPPSMHTGALDPYTVDLHPYTVDHRLPGAAEVELTGLPPRSNPFFYGPTAQASASSDQDSSTRNLQNKVLLHKKNGRRILMSKIHNQ